MIGQNDFEYLYKKMLPGVIENYFFMASLHELESTVRDESCSILGIPADRRVATQIIIDKNDGSWRRVKCGLIAYELAELNHERSFFDKLGQCEQTISTSPYRGDNCLEYPWFYKEGFQLLQRLSNVWAPVSTGPLSFIYNNGVVLFDEISTDSYRFVKNWFSAFFPGIIFMTYAEWDKCDLDLKRYLLLADVSYTKASRINPLLLVNDVSPLELFGVDKSLLESLKKRDSLPEGVKFSLDLWSNYG
jgi:hypothetical protein